jgi:hypothetical protein
MNWRRAIEKTPERTPIEIHIASLVNKANPIRIYTDVNAKVKRRGYDYFEIVFPSGFFREGPAVVRSFHAAGEQ